MSIDSKQSRIKAEESRHADSLTGADLSNPGSNVDAVVEFHPASLGDRAEHSPSGNFANSLNSSASAKSPQVVFYLIGLLLTATALSKLWMLVTDSFADVRVGIPKEILWLSVAFELWLALENFRIRNHRVLAFLQSLARSAGCWVIDPVVVPETLNCQVGCSS